MAYCICLGIFSLTVYRQSRINRILALFTFSAAFFNAADFVIFIPNQTVGLWYSRFTNMAVSWTVPSIIFFVYEATGVADLPVYMKRIKLAFGFGAISTVMFFTPFMVRDVHYVPFQSSLNVEVPGVAYGCFAVLFLMIFYDTALQLPKIYKAASGLHRKRALYVMLAYCTGGLALTIYFLSLVSIDMPYLYYPLEALMCFTFAYAIFKDNLITVPVALRRASLLMGIYVGIGFLFAPIVFLFHKSFLVNTNLGALLFLLVIAGLLFSLSPFFYAQMVQRSALFQDRDTLHLTHEFKTPLSAIQSAQEILERELASSSPDSRRVQEYMSMIQRNTQRLEKFVMDILSVGKAREMSLEIQKQSVDIEALLRDVIGHFPNTHIQLTSSIKTCIIDADPESLRQVFTNLIANALSSMIDGTVHVSLSRKQNLIEVMVRDHGAGIPREDLDRIFKPFVRSKQGGHAKSTGLGLAIAERCVHAHNGRIWAESDGVGKGATFFVVLPIGR